jgi:uncharacterized membrane protein YfcA
MNEHMLLGAGLGTVIGLILALTGAGGGILAVPLLVFGLGLSMVQAAPVGLLAVGLASAVGALLGLRQGIVRYRAACFISAIGVVMAPLGLWLAHRIPNTPLALIFAVVLGVGGGFVIIPALTRYTDLNMKSIVATSLAVIALVSIGSVITASVTGAMHWAVGAPFAVGAVVGLMVGRQIAHHLAGPRLQQLFAVVGVMAALMLAFNALGGA